MSEEAMHERHRETSVRSYEGPERRCSNLPCAEADTIEGILKEVQALRRDLFTSNGHDAIIPAIHHRLEAMENQMLPHDDLHDVIRDYKWGKTILAYLTMCAIVGGAAILFWHLFQKRL